MDALRFGKIIPPAVATIDRIASSIAAVGREDMFRRIASRLDPSARQVLERVLEVAPGQSRSLLFRFREYPPEATPTSLTDYDVQALKRFAPETRTAMLVCFLVEAHKSLLDHRLPCTSSTSRVSCAAAAMRSTSVIASFASAPGGESKRCCRPWRSYWSASPRIR